MIFPIIADRIAFHALQLLIFQGVDRIDKRAAVLVAGSASRQGDIRTEASPLFRVGIVKLLFKGKHKMKTINY